MKNILLYVSCMLAAGITNAQVQFGIINYSLPEGWHSRQSGNDIVLEKKGTENSGCNITLFEQVNSVVNSEKQYAEFWNLKTNSGNAKIANTIPAVKEEEGGWVSFSGAKTTGKGTSTSTEGFYTLSDGTRTVMILAQAGANSCIDEIDIILASIDISEKETNSRTTSKARTRAVRGQPLKSLKALAVDKLPPKR